MALTAFRTCCIETATCRLYHDVFRHKASEILSIASNDIYIDERMGKGSICCFGGQHFIWSVRRIDKAVRLINTFHPFQQLDNDFVSIFAYLFFSTNIQLYVLLNWVQIESFEIIYRTSTCTFHFLNWKLYFKLNWIKVSRKGNHHLIRWKYHGRIAYLSICRSLSCKGFFYHRIQRMSDW